VIKKIIKFLLVTVLILLAVFHKLVFYGVGQLYGQLNIIWNAEPVEEVISRSSTPDSVKQKLNFIDEVRRFAMDSIGLKNSKNYTTFYDQKNKPVMFVVTGCLPYEMKAKEWWFPVLGNVSYKGFFEEEKAAKEERRLQLEGYDTDIYSPSAWSTLGFFKDPVLSNMLKRGPGRLAELIIHELTHATIYLESSVTFNENFATFVGERGAELFLNSKFGTDSEELKRYQGFLHDEEVYGNYMLQAANQLDSLYKSMPTGLGTYEKAKIKYTKIADIMSGIRHLPLKYPQRYLFDFTKDTLPNNTEFMAYMRYRKEQDVFQSAFEKLYQSNLRFFIKDVVERSESGKEMPF
jgi:predicted aminopeptidase